MKRLDAWFLQLFLLAVLASGFLYAWLRWFQGDLADPEAAPGAAALEGHTRRVHLLAAAGSMFALGLVWRTHVLLRLPEPRGRRTGLLLAALALLAAPSGYLLQALDAEGLRAFLGVAHAAAGALLLPAFVAHRLAVRRRARPPANEPAPPAAAPRARARVLHGAAPPA